MTTGVPDAFKFKERECLLTLMALWDCAGIARKAKVRVGEAFWVMKRIYARG
jgi:hypothetical protein